MVQLSASLCSVSCGSSAMCKFSMEWLYPSPLPFLPSLPGHSIEIISLTSHLVNNHVLSCAPYRVHYDNCLLTAAHYNSDLPPVASFFHFTAAPSGTKTPFMALKEAKWKEGWSSPLVLTKPDFFHTATLACSPVSAIPLEDAICFLFKSSNLAIFFSHTVHSNSTGELHVCLLPHVWHLSFTLTYTTYTFSVTLSQAAFKCQLVWPPKSSFSGTKSQLHIYYWWQQVCSLRSSFFLTKPARLTFYSFCT